MDAIIGLVWTLLVVVVAPSCVASAPIGQIHSAPAEGILGNVVEGRTSVSVTTTTTPATMVEEDFSMPPRILGKTTAAPGMPKNLIKGLVIAAPLFAALLLAPILLTCSRKKLAQRKVRKFQRRELQKPTTDIVVATTNSKRNRKASASTSVTCLLETTGDELKSENENTESDRRPPVITTGAPGVPLRVLNIRPSLKRTKALLCTEPPKTGPEHHLDMMPLKPVKRIRIPTLRPVSVDLGAGVSMMGRTPRNEKKRHSTHVLMESFAQSESTSHSRLTVIENLAYEDTLPSLPGSHCSVARIGNVKNFNANHKFNVPAMTTDFAALSDQLPRSVLRRKLDHQYETITCDTNDVTTSVTLRRPRLRPPSPVQIKRESKSEDVTIFPTRNSRSSHQYEMMTIGEKSSNLPPDNLLLKPLEKQGTVEKGNLPEKGFESHIYVKDNLKTKVCNEEDTARKDATPGGTPDVPVKTEAETRCAGFTNDYQRTRSKSEPKNMRRVQKDFILHPRPPTILEQEAIELAGNQARKPRKEKTKLPKKEKKRKNDNKKVVCKPATRHGNQPGTNEAPRPRRQHAKRKVRKKRRSRDELRQKLQMRLMGYNPATGFGTGESYRTDNNERCSGFVAGVRLKLGPEPGSTDTSGEGQGNFRRRRRIHSHDEWYGRWGDARVAETTLLEEIWRHLNVIAERSRLLKDSSSSRRRSQSLTSTDSSPNQRRGRGHHGRRGASDIEETTGSSEVDDGEDDDNNDDVIVIDDVIEQRHIDESTSDNGYCTYGHLPSSLRLPLRPPGGAAVQNQGPQGAGWAYKYPPATELTPGQEIDTLSTDVPCATHLKEEATVPQNSNVASGSSGHGHERVRLRQPRSECDVIVTKDEKLPALRHDGVSVPVYEKLTDFCSMSSSVSSSCSSLATLTFVPIPQIAKIPQALQEKISLEAVNAEKISRSHDSPAAGTSTARDVENGGGSQRSNLPNVVKQAPFRLSLVNKLALDAEHQSKEMAPVLYPYSRPARWRQRANSDSNYVVVPPSLLLCRARVKTKIELIAENPIKDQSSYVTSDDVMHSRPNTDAGCSKSNKIDSRCAENYPSVGQCAIVDSKNACDAVDTNDDVSSRSGSDNVFHDVTAEKCDDSDESLFQVFMEMAV